MPTANTSPEQPSDDRNGDRRAQRARRIRATLGPIAVLATVDRVTGQVREHLVHCASHDDGWIVAVTPNAPRGSTDWYADIRAGAKAVMVDGAERHVIRGRETRGRERARLWRQLRGVDPRISDPLPPLGAQVLVLERLGVFASR